MHVKIDDKIFTGFPQVPTVGTRVRIGGEVRIISSVIIEPDGEFECVTEPDPEDGGKQDAKETPSKEFFGRRDKRKPTAGA